MSEVQFGRLKGNGTALVATVRDDGDVNTHVGMTFRRTVIIEVALKGSAGGQGQQRGQANGCEHVHASRRI